jgi:hypothetical protein
MSKTEQEERVPFWRKSKHSINGGNCTEVAAVHGTVMVRDSVSRSTVQLRFAPEAWREFTDRLKGA